MIRVCAIAAIDEERGIGKEGDLPWCVPEDLKHFGRLTSGHTVLMGRSTYDSLKAPFKPLPNRVNIVATRNSGSITDAADSVEVISDPIAFIQECKAGKRKLSSDILWVIGGEQIYRETMRLWDEVFLTLVKGKHAADRFMPEFESEFRLADREDYAGFSFLHYVRNFSSGGVGRDPSP